MTNHTSAQDIALADAFPSVMVNLLSLVQINAPFTPFDCHLLVLTSSAYGIFGSVFLRMLVLVGLVSF